MEQKVKALTCRMVAFNLLGYAYTLNQIGVQADSPLCWSPDGQLCEFLLDLTR